MPQARATGVLIRVPPGYRPSGPPSHCANCNNFRVQLGQGWSRRGKCAVSAMHVSEDWVCDEFSAYAPVDEEDTSSAEGVDQRNITR